MIKRSKVDYKAYSTFTPKQKQAMESSNSIILSENHSSQSGLGLVIIRKSEDL
jgi:hypothetical protein